MAYIGNEPSTKVTGNYTVDTFTGDGANVNFTLSYAVPVGNPAALEVFVANVQQQPTVAYSVSGSDNKTLTFTEAPANGDPIYVIAKGEIGTLIAPGTATVNTSTIADGAVTAAKLGTVYAANITGLGSLATASSVANTQITGNIIASQITSVANTQVTGIQTIAQGGTNNTTFTSPSGNTAGLVYYDGSKFANDGTVTDAGYDTVTNTLQSRNFSSTGTATIANLATTSYGSIKGLFESGNVTATAPTANTNIDVVTQTIQYFTANASVNTTINFRGNSTTTLDSIMSNGNTISSAVLITNGSSAYYPTVYQIDGTAITPKWSGGTAPTGGNATATDLYSYSITKTAANTYVMFASQTKFA